MIKNGYKRITITLSKTIIDYLDAQCKRSGKTYSQLITRFILRLPVAGNEHPFEIGDLVDK